MEAEKRLEVLNDYPVDFRETKPIEPTCLPPDKRQELIEMIREGVGLIKFAHASIQKIYDDAAEFLHGRELHPEVRTLLADLLLRLEGIIHISAVLSKEFGGIWTLLRAHELWEMLQAERKRLQAEARREKRRSKQKSED